MKKELYLKHNCNRGQGFSESHGSMTILFVINPASGGKPEKRLPAIEAGCRKRGIEYVILRTGPDGLEARNVFQSIAAVRGLDRVAAVGGDGTVTETAAALTGAGLPMGIIPLGTGNDYARGIGLPPGRDIEACLEIVANGVPRRVDIARYRTDAKEGIFLNVASAGFDAAATREAIRFKKRISRPLIYLLGVVAALPALRFSDIAIEADGNRLRRRALMVAVANGRRYGGGIRINPDGAPDDGRLEMVMYRAASPIVMAATLPGFLLDRHRRLDHVETLKCRSVRIEAERPLPVNIDGDIKGTTPLAVDIIPGGLTLLTPPMSAMKAYSP